jgi:hypothetical protein
LEDLSVTYKGWKASPKYQGLFNKYNKKYFNDLLPSVKVGTAPLLQISYITNKSTVKPEDIDGGEYGLAGIASDNTCYIVLDKGMTVFHPSVAEVTLLHEMCHFMIGLDKGHGKYFKTQLRRLAALGAYDNLL